MRIENTLLKLNEIISNTVLLSYYRTNRIINRVKWCDVVDSRYQIPVMGNICFADPSNPIEYQLSNAHFVELGWTLLPITKTMRKIVQYEARPAKPSLNW